MSDWVLLIPPSETKAGPPGNGMLFDNARRSRRTNSFRELEEAREMVFDSLQAVLNRNGGWEEVFEVRGSALEEALRLNRSFQRSTTMPARDLYQGVMYQAINFRTLKAAEKKIFDKQALIFSGLFGLVRPTDRIPPYKLKMTSNLGGVVGRVGNFWRRPVSEILRRELRGKVVWDFLPDQYRRVWDGTGEVEAVHQVKFVKRVIRSGVAEWKTISHHSKALKGALIRHLLMKDASSPKALRDFTHPDGYHYDPSLSVEGRRQALLVFAAE
ncbi:MAG: peroxide stress protein YaaA [Candidatus Sumerlaeia bacterium]|nr:peroxide stress protein YaaA [Candidatus Sumerlaeia bacterium]